MKSSFHTPVMVKEVIEYLNPKENGVYVDCTLGTGGHSLAILEKIGGNIKLVGIDWDEEAIKVSSERLKDYKDKVVIVKANFADIDKILREKCIDRVNGVLYDLGLSSLQLENNKRGFSFLKDMPLDMRMDREGEITAGYLVNHLSKDELENIFWNFGQERWARRMAEFIVEERKKSPILTTKQLVDVLKKAVPSRFRRGRRIHFATKVFQALRIAVNQELENLEQSLSKAIRLLYSGGRICVISYHSLEDRIIKGKFKQVEGKELFILTRKVVKPSWEEVKSNPRSRSARLRAAERI
ncbi:16S rRNA (cytosine(1402)-N(4))-methyltransferase RsmH [Candidatus Aerophobetes bacterium]|nr:16S rRNA (cytosine(1402)-N(4))-methyltransferase RsmH [Candidatus Aerophobetes bacterium]